MYKRLLAALAAAALLCLVPFGAAAAPEPTALPVVMYHHISADAGRVGDYVITPQQLAGDLVALRREGYTAVSAADLLAFVRGEDALPDKPVLLTFDDGQASFAAYALPLLEEYEMSAVLAVIGSCADQYTQSGDHNLNYCHSTWPELAQLEASPWAELAVHTYDLHHLTPRKGCQILPGESEAHYAALLNGDLDRIEAQFRRYMDLQPTVFAYPYGLTCPQAREILCSRGYQILLTCEEQVNRLTGDPEELLHLGRFNRSGREDFSRLMARWEE